MVRELVGRWCSCRVKLYGYVIRSAESACSSRIIPASNARTSRTRRLRCKPHVPQEWAVDLLFFNLPSFAIRGFDAVPRRKSTLCHLGSVLTQAYPGRCDGGEMDEKEGWQDK